MFTSERFLICIPLEAFIFGFVCFLSAKITAKNLSFYLILLLLWFLCIIQVKAITRDIKELDTAKTNLTFSITTLENLSMLVRSIEDLS